MFPGLSICAELVNGGILLVCVCCAECRGDNAGAMLWTGISQNMG